MMVSQDLCSRMNPVNSSVASWDSPPRPNDPTYALFENAFKRLVASRSVTVPSRGKNDLVKKEGVSWLVGKAFTVESQPQLGQDPKYKLMPFQIDGVNWLCHNWNTNQNCILADEMGLVSARSITGP